MPTTVKTGWLKDKNGDKFAPKTLTSQVQTSDGVLLEDKIQADLDALQSTLDGKANASHTHDYIPNSLKGAANGLAELDSSGKVPSSQLPSYVDDVLEYTSKSSFPTTGESGKIYVDTATNKTYRWSGSAFVEISASLALGETSSTAYRGDRGKAAYDHSKAAHAPSNAEKNQNAFSNVTVGSTTITADSTTDTLTLVAGSNVTITPDATNDKITIAATDTKYTHPSTHPASMITAGTFAGAVKANSSGETYSTYCLRNTRLASSATNPTVNGEICWTYA